MVDAQTKEREDGYRRHGRPEVAALIPGGARRVVDVGCGEGRLGAFLKSSRPQTEVRGVEIDELAAARASLVLDAVARRDASLGMVDEWPDPDCIVFSDLLEHLADPWSTIRKWVERLPPGGWVVISVPNVSHYTIIKALLRGSWEYADSGLLDRSHLRFFARDDLFDLVRGAELRPEHLSRKLVVPRIPLLDRWVAGEAGREKGTPARSRIVRFLLDSCTFQYLMCASKPDPATRA